MAGFLGDFIPRERLGIYTEQNWKRKYRLQHGPSNFFILDTSETMEGEGFTQMKKTFVSMIESYALHPNLNERVAVIHFGKENKYLHDLSNNYESLKKILDDVSCSGPSPMIEGFLLAIPGLEELQSMTGIGLFTLRARIILISDGRTTTSGHSDSNCYNHQIEDHKTIQLLEQVKQIGNQHPIICVPVGNDPNISLLGTIAHGSLGGKLVYPEEARKFTQYSFGMMIATEIIGEMPTTMCSIDDVKNIVLSSRRQSYVTEHDLENVVEILNNRRAYEMNVYRNEEYLEKEVYTERNECLLAPGTRVRRGPNWRYGDQDSNGSGTVTGHRNRDGWIFVEWDTGMRFPYEYVNDSQEENVIIPCDEPRILQRENIAVGCLVKRGPDWKWEDQDGGDGNVGAVYRVKEDTVYVRWPNGNKSNYRFGYGGKFDLVVCDPFDECLVVSQKCTIMPTCTDGKTTGRTLFETGEISFKDTLGLINIEKIHQNDSNLENDEEQEGAILWQWKNEQGRWKNFPKTEHQKIEKAIAKNSKSTILLAIGGHMFRLVLSKLRLINISSRETFEVRRCENSSENQAKN